MTEIKESKAMMPVVAVAGAILIGGAGFFGGTMCQKSLTPKNAFGGQMMGGNFNRGTGGARGGAVGGANTGSQRGGMGFRPVVGSILSKDDKSITVKLQDGSSKIVMLSSTTEINKAEKADVAGLVVGETVRVFGITNSDGSVTAQDVQLNPELLGQQVQGK